MQRRGKCVRAGFALEERLNDGRVPAMAKGMTYVVVAAGGLRVKSLNTFWAHGQYVEIDPSFLAVCDELRERITQKLLVPVSANSEYRQGGPTGLVPSGDEMASLRRGAAARGRAPVVVNNISLDRDQVVRDHLSGKSIKAMAREVAAEASGRAGFEFDDDIIERIAARVAAMLPSPDSGSGGLDKESEGRIAAKVAEMLLPAIQASGGGTAVEKQKKGVIEVEVDTAPLPDMRKSREDVEVNLGDDLANRSTGDSVEDQVADIERILRERDKEE